MNEHERRVGLNEAVFREVNESLRDVNDAFGRLTDKVALICECGRVDCVERLSMTPAEYEELRSDPVLFAVVPGHETAEVEEVVERHGEYDVVRKHPGVPAELAKATQPLT